MTETAIRSGKGNFQVTEPFDFERKVWLLRRKADVSSADQAYQGRPFH